MAEVREYLADKVGSPTVPAEQPGPAPTIDLSEPLVETPAKKKKKVSPWADLAGDQVGRLHHAYTRSTLLTEECFSAQGIGRRPVGEGGQDCREASRARTIRVPEDQRLLRGESKSVAFT